MKKVLCIALLIFTMLSCSNDDDEIEIIIPEPEPQLSVSERLVNGSPFMYTFPEITVVYENEGFTNNQLIQFNNEYVGNLTFDFQPNQNVLLFDNQTEINATFVIVQNDMILTIGNGETLLLPNFQFTGTNSTIDSLSFTEDFDYFSDDANDWYAGWEARLFFE
jgi:hypothetical protein